MSGVAWCGSQELARVEDFEDEADHGGDPNVCKYTGNGPEGMGDSRVLTGTRGDSRGLTAMHGTMGQCDACGEVARACVCVCVCACACVCAYRPADP